MAPAATPLFRATDLAAFVAALGERLRKAGVGVSQNGLIAFARAMQANPPDSVPSLYWGARITLVSRQHELAAFDLVFAAVFENASMEVDPHARRAAGHTAGQEGDVLVRVRARASAESDGAGLPWQTLPAASAREGHEDSTVVLHERLPSSLAGLAEVPFTDLDPLELDLLYLWLEKALRHWPTRRTRRRKPHHHGSVVDLRRTIGRARRTGGDPAVLVHTRQNRKRRSVVMLCDVSQSMQPYTTAYLHLMRTLARGGNAETFAFSTSLTRLTAALAHRSSREAIDQASERVIDRFGGTHIAANISALLASRHGNAIRGAIVVIASDGWDNDPPEQLAKAMEKLSRRAHRVVWLNPRAGFAGFAPLVASMSAALPYCDSFLPAHTVTALGEALEVIGGASGR